jgi:hypothetical protein
LHFDPGKTPVGAMVAVSVSALIDLRTVYAWTRGFCALSNIKGKGPAEEDACQHAKRQTLPALSPERFGAQDHGASSSV